MTTASERRPDPPRAAATGDVRRDRRRRPAAAARRERGVPAGRGRRDGADPAGALPLRRRRLRARGARHAADLRRRRGGDGPGSRRARRRGSGGADRRRGDRVPHLGAGQPARSSGWSSPRRRCPATPRTSTRSRCWPTPSRRVRRGGVAVHRLLRRALLPALGPGPVPCPVPRGAGAGCRGPWESAEDSPKRGLAEMFGERRGRRPVALRARLGPALRHRHPRGLRTHGPPARPSPARSSGRRSSRSAPASAWPATGSGCAASPATPS